MRRRLNGSKKHDGELHIDLSTLRKNRGKHHALDPLSYRATMTAQSWVSGPALRWMERILGERYGLEIQLSHIDDAITLRVMGSAGSIVFDQLNSDFRRNASDLPCAWWEPVGEGWHSVLDLPLAAVGESRLSTPLIETSRRGFVIHYDILGLAFWMLARVEEIGRRDLDEHGRFPATASHAYKHDYLDRPIVDEWLAILGQVIHSAWPSVELKRHQFTMRLSHDVDRPSRYGFHSATGLLRAMGGDVVKRGAVVSALKGPWIRHATKQHLHSSDPYNTFGWIMDVSEAQGLKSAFYFICGRTHPKKDALYDPEHPAIRKLMRQIHERGHEIGLHPSYGTWKQPELLIGEAQRLRRVWMEEGIEQNEWGGRMHYLRYEMPTTLRAWNLAGAAYDTTLGYADCAGFRCGTCFEYPAFDPIRHETIHVRVRPLIVMEATVLAARYTSLQSLELASQVIDKLKTRCQLLDGQFTLLWHNSELWSGELRAAYVTAASESFNNTYAT